MRALVKSRAEPGIWMEEIDQPAVGPNDVLVEVAKSSICGYRPPHRRLGRVGSAHDSRADGYRP